MHNILKQTKLFGILAITLGLAPYSPEPHIWGKIKWIMGGAEGMQTMDYFDTILHGTPWVMLILSLAYQALLMLKSRT